MTALDLQAQLLIDGVWTEVPCYAEDGWSTQLGPSVQSGTQPNTLSISMASPSLEMDPTNPESPHYGKIGQNTRARILIDGDVIGHGEAAGLEPEVTEEHVPGARRGRSWVNLEAEGLLRRLGSWDDPIASAMTRQTLSYDLLGFWPGEDDSEAGSIFQASEADAPPGFYSGDVSLAGDDGAGGSGQLLTIGADARIDFRFARSPGNGYQLVFVMKLKQMPSSGTYEDLMMWTDGDGRTWQWQVNATSFNFLITAADGTVLRSFNVGFGSTSPALGYLRYRMHVTVAGGTITYAPAWYRQDGSVITGITDTFAGTRASRPVTARVVGNPWTDGAAFGQVFAISDTTLNITAGEPLRAFNGYAGETPFWRYYRLMQEEGLTAWWDGDWQASTKPMGRQKPGIFLDLLEEAARTEGGLLYDDVADVALRLRLHNSLVGQASQLDLARTDLIPPLRKRITDTGSANDITGENWNGAKSRAVLEAGPKSVLPPPAGVGRYRKSLPVSFRDLADLEQRTRFALAEGTVDRPRYPSLTIDLLGRPDLRAAVTALRPGDLITLAGVEADVVPLLAMTIKRRGDGVNDTVTLDCVPADVWLTAVYDGPARYDLRSSALAQPAASGDTVLMLTTGRIDESWSTAGGYDLMIAGERVTVARMQAIGSILLADGTLESGVTGWSAFNGTLTSSTAQAHTGIRSGLLTVTGSPTQSYVRASVIPVVAGQQYRMSGWVRTTGTVAMSIDFYRADSSYLTTLGTVAAPGGGSWVSHSGVFTAPATAAFARPGPTLSGSPPGGTQLFFDDVDFLDAAPVGRPQRATVVRSVNGIVKALPAGAEVHVATRGRWGL